MTRRRKILITGATSGIGKKTAILLAEANYDLILLGRDEDKLKHIKSNLMNSLVYTYCCDFENITKTLEIFDRVLGEHNYLDGIVNNAGKSGTDWDKLDICDWAKTITVNLTIPFLIIKRLLPLLKKGMNPSIVNISSLAAFDGYSKVDYAVSKGGLISLTKSLAKILGENNIRVNAILPGPIDTGVTQHWPKSIKERYIADTPLMRLTRDIDVANLIKFLLSDDASQITGATIDISGGFGIGRF